MQKVLSITITGCLTLLLTIAFLIPAYLINGLAIMLLWEWFVAGTFDVATLNMTQSIGLGLFVGIVTYTYVPMKTMEDKYLAVALSYIMPLFSIVVGCILRFFM